MLLKSIQYSWLFFLLPLCVHAQTESPEPAYWQLSIGDTAIVFADIAYIRDSPALEGTVVKDSLPAGTRVRISSKALSSSIVRGFRTPWQEISYLKNGQLKRGYISQGLLALGQTTIDKGQFCIFGFDRYTPMLEDKPAFYSCRVKLIGTQQSIVAAQSFSFNYTEQSAVEIKGLNGMGLKNLHNIIRIGFLGEACAVSSDYFYFGWNGTVFISLPEAYRVSDAGVYYHTEQMLFPSEHKRNNTIIYKMIEEGEATEEDNSKEIRYKVKKWKQAYRWNGSEYTLIKGQKK